MNTSVTVHLHIEQLCKAAIAYLEHELKRIRDNDAAPEPARSTLKHELHLKHDALHTAQRHIAEYERQLFDGADVRIVSASSKAIGGKPASMQIVIKGGGRSYTRHLKLNGGAYYGHSLLYRGLVQYGKSASDIERSPVELAEAA